MSNLARFHPARYAAFNAATAAHAAAVKTVQKADAAHNAALQCQAAVMDNRPLAIAEYAGAALEAADAAHAAAVSAAHRTHLALISVEPAPGWNPPRERATLSVPLTCAARGSRSISPRLPDLMAPCGQEAVVVSIRRDDASAADARCAAHPPGPQYWRRPLWRRFRPEHAARAQRIQCAIEEISRVCSWLSLTDPDPEARPDRFDTSCGEDISLTLAALRLAKQLDELALPESELPEPAEPAAAAA